MISESPEPGLRRVLDKCRNKRVERRWSYRGGWVVDDGDVVVVPGAPFGDRWVFVFPFVFPVVPVVEGLVVSG